MSNATEKQKTFIQLLMHFGYRVKENPIYPDTIHLISKEIGVEVMVHNTHGRYSARRISATTITFYRLLIPVETEMVKLIQKIRFTLRSEDSRREYDFHETQSLITKGFLDDGWYDKVYGNIIEPCVGEGAITDVIKSHQKLIDCGGLIGGNIITNDVDTKRSATYHMDASKPPLWKRIINEHGEVDWVITNPPYNLAPQIGQLAIRHARVGVAMLLRLSFIEPCQNRKWIRDNPPSHQIVVGDPRPSFRRNKKGQRATDSVTVAWYMWLKGAGSRISFITNDGSKWE